jgi:hypothetical protein
VPAPPKDTLVNHEQKDVVRAVQQPVPIEAAAKSIKQSASDSRAAAAGSGIGKASSADEVPPHDEYDTLDRVERREVGFWTSDKKPSSPRAADSVYYGYRSFASCPKMEFVDPVPLPSRVFSFPYFNE